MDIFGATDRIANQSDRYWVAGLFILLIVFVVWVGKWLVKKYETLVEQQRQDQQQYTVSLLNITGNSAKNAAELTVALDRNTHAIENNTILLNVVKERLK